MNRSNKKMKLDGSSSGRHSHHNHGGFGSRSNNTNNGSSIHSGHYMTSYLHDQNEDTVEMPIASPDATNNEVTLNTTINADQDQFQDQENEQSANTSSSMVNKNQTTCQIANQINSNPKIENSVMNRNGMATGTTAVRKVIINGPQGMIQVMSKSNGGSISGGLTLDKANKSLKNLMYYIKTAYSNNLTSPKWKSFKGLQVTEKIRLNNVIWRSWFEQYGTKDTFKTRKRRLICQFANGLEEQPVSTKMSIKEGKFWKARLESITNEYKKWREISRKQIKATSDGTQLDVNIIQSVENNSSYKMNNNNMYNDMNNTNYILQNKNSLNSNQNIINNNNNQNSYILNNLTGLQGSNFSSAYYEPTSSASMQNFNNQNQLNNNQHIQQTNIYYSNNLNAGGGLNSNVMNSSQYTLQSNNLTNNLNNDNNFSNLNQNLTQIQNSSNLNYQNSNFSHNNNQQNFPSTSNLNSKGSSSSNVIITTSTTSSGSPTSSFTTSSSSSNMNSSYHNLPIASKQMTYNNRCRSPSPGLFQDFDLYNFSSDTLFSTYLVEDPKDTIFGTNPDLFQPDLMHLYPNFDFFDLDFRQDDVYTNNNLNNNDNNNNTSNGADVNKKSERNSSVINNQQHISTDNNNINTNTNSNNNNNNTNRNDNNQTFNVQRSDNLQNLAVRKSGKQPPSLDHQNQLHQQQQQQQQLSLQQSQAQSQQESQAQMIAIDYLSNFDTLATVAAAQSLNMSPNSNVIHQQIESPQPQLTLPTQQQFQQHRSQKQRHISELGDLQSLRNSNSSNTNQSVLSGASHQLKMPVSLSELNSTLNANPIQQQAQHFNNLSNASNNNNNTISTNNFQTGNNNGNNNSNNNNNNNNRSNSSNINNTLQSLSTSSSGSNSSNTIRNLLAISSPNIQPSNNTANIKTNPNPTSNFRLSTGISPVVGATIPSPNRKQQLQHQQTQNIFQTTANTLSNLISDMNQQTKVASPPTPQSNMSLQLSPQNQSKKKTDNQSISTLLSAVLAPVSNSATELNITNSLSNTSSATDQIKDTKPPPNKRGRKSNAVDSNNTNSNSRGNSRTSISRGSSQSKLKKEEIVINQQSQQKIQSQQQQQQINGSMLNNENSDSSANSPLNSPSNVNFNSNYNNSSYQIQSTASANFQNADSNSSEYPIGSKYSRFNSNTSTNKSDLYNIGSASSRMSRSNSVNSISTLNDASLTTAEQKRRCNIQHGFDRLQVLVPSLKEGKNLKVSKAVMLQKTSEYIKELQLAKEKRVADLEAYKKEIEDLSDKITECQNQLPANGVSVLGNLNKTEKFEQKFNSYVKDKTMKEWKFYLFSLILKPLFDNFIQTINTSSQEDMESTFYEWQQRHCNLMQLRPIASNALRSLSRTTSILTESVKLKDECLSAALTK